MTCVYCHEDFAGSPTACPNCGLPTTDPGAPGRASHSILDRTLSWSRTSFAGFFDRLRHSPGGVWAIPLAVGLIAGLFLGLGYALGNNSGEEPIARDNQSVPTTASPMTPEATPVPAVQTASSALPLVPDLVAAPVITQALPKTATEEALPPKPAHLNRVVSDSDGIDYFAEPKAVKPKAKRLPRPQYANWAQWETQRTSLPPPHVLAMNPHRERAPVYVYLMGIEHPYLNEVTNSFESGGQYGPGPRLDFTGE